MLCRDLNWFLPHLILNRRIHRLSLLTTGLLGQSTESSCSKKILANWSGISFEFLVIAGQLPCPHRSIASFEMLSQTRVDFLEMWNVNTRYVEIVRHFESCLSLMSKFSAADFLARFWKQWFWFVFAAAIFFARSLNFASVTLENSFWFETPTTDFQHIVLWCSILPDWELWASQDDSMHSSLAL